LAAILRIKTMFEVNKNCIVCCPVHKNKKTLAHSFTLLVYSLVRVPRKCTSHKIKTLLILKSQSVTLEIENFGIISILFFLKLICYTERLHLDVE
jgi:hypothetical protein